MATYEITSLAVSAIKLAAGASSAEKATFAENAGVDLAQDGNDVIVVFDTGRGGARLPLQPGQFLVTYADGTREAFWPGELADVFDQTVTAALTGTFLTTPTESEVVTGGQTIIITLTGGEWVDAEDPDFPTIFSAATAAAIAAGLDSAQSEAAGWDAEVKVALDETNIIRTSDTVVTVTLPASASYSVTTNEVITVTLPVAALKDVISAVVATPTITIVANS